MAAERAKTLPAPPELAFYGGSFTAMGRDIMLAYLNAGRALYDSGIISGIRFSTRPDAVDGDILDTLAPYPITTIELGAQSMDARVLEICGRGHTPDDTVTAARLIKSRGISLILQMMCGLPGDSDGGAQDTAARLAELGPGGARIYPCVVLTDTALEAMWRQGEYTPLSVETAADMCARLIKIFEGRGVPVIRVGLDTSETLAAAALAGPYHPAFGHIARSRLWLWQAEETLRGYRDTAGKTAVVTVRRGAAALMAGHKRENIERLKKLFNLRVIRIYEKDDPAGGMEIRLEPLP